jgi:two-component system, NarL family, sensor kinase
LKRYLTSLPASTRSDFRKRPAVGAERGDDQLYWTVASDYLFAVRVLRGRTFAYDAINPALKAAFGASSDDVTGTPLSYYLGVKDTRALCKVFRNCLGEGAQVRVRHRLALGGSAREFETTVTPVFDPDTGIVLKLLGSHRDVSRESSQRDTEWTPDEDRRVSASLVHLQEDIQQRIASDLHDSTCQYLIAASLTVMRVRTAFGDPAVAERLCDDIDASIDQALKEMRAFAYLLHPRNLTVDGLKMSVEQYASGFGARTALQVKTRISPEVDRLPYQSQHSLLRVVQEALTNVFRHARATAVEISGKAADDNIELRISDNGRGMPAGQAMGGPSILLGVGIPAMRARLEQMGGKLEIRSAPGESGTTLCAIIPYDRKRRRLNRSNVVTDIRARGRTEVAAGSSNMQSGANRTPESTAK